VCYKKKLDLDLLEDGARHAAQSVGLLWTSDQLVAEASN